MVCLYDEGMPVGPRVCVILDPLGTLNRTSVSIERESKSARTMGAESGGLDVYVSSFAGLGGGMIRS
jgi:hypothetical protein